LAEHYERHLTPLRLAELPERPHFILPGAAGLHGGVRQIGAAAFAAMPNGGRGIVSNFAAKMKTPLFVCLSGSAMDGGNGAAGAQTGRSSAAP
jgi:hypothetical protein